jgi:Ca2+-binding RTX toxin-like protein
LTFIFIANRQPTDFRTLDFKGMFSGRVASSSSFSVTFDQSSGTHSVFQGKDLKVDANGKFTSGVLSQFQMQYPNGSVKIYFNISDLKLSAASFQNLCLHGSTKSALNTVLKGKTSIAGSHKKDYIVGLGGNDYIYSNDGADKILGDAGHDTLAGGLGNDALTGGTGRDAFLFDEKLNAQKNIDLITDFKVKDDSIYLDDAIFEALRPSFSFTKPVAISIDALWIGAEAHDDTDRIIYNDATGVISYDPDGTGVLTATAFAKINKNLALTSQDFFVV